MTDHDRIKTIVEKVLADEAETSEPTPEEIARRSRQ